MEPSIESRLSVVEHRVEAQGNEHATLWKKIDENAIQHEIFIRAIARLETKLAVYFALSAFIGTLIGGGISSIIAAVIVSNILPVQSVPLP